MRLGLVARADNSGLGIQTWEFYRHMKPYRTMVVDISKLNGNKQYYERYSTHDTLFVKGIPTPNDIDHFLSELDVVFIAESAYNPLLYIRARELGIKTANQYNYEFFDWFSPNHTKPDMFIAPSMWHYADVNGLVNHTNQHTGSNISHTYLHCPVNRDVLPQRIIKQARTFLHVAGRAAAHDRNGTITVIKAAKYLKTKAQILIHFQGEQGLAHQATSTLGDYMQLLAEQHVDNVTIEQNEYDNYQDIYKHGDVLVLPRRYGGNCLPMNEALSVGMPVIMTDISPNNSFLPANWLVPATEPVPFTPRTTIEVYNSKPEDLATKIDEFYNMSEDQMWFENLRALNLAKSISWLNMKPKYQEALEALCNQ